MATCGYICCMGIFSIREVKDSFSELGRRVDKGERVLISRHGEPVYELVAYKKKGGIDYEAGKRFLEMRGIKNPVPYIADDFDDPLPEDFLLRPLP